MSLKFGRSPYYISKMAISKKITKLNSVNNKGNISLKVSYYIPIWPAGIMKKLLTFQREVYH